ncbi:suppressor of fused homolog [Neocloeon triangulifer]|uniref:suppressor of fused homolog n=1 Tax=Neocloeon triangulifer TaxID=2078957 RepID=UPI00286F041F|nr:suppressor of fused homolog [Neocloeon triangulifer]
MEDGEAEDRTRVSLVVPTPPGLDALYTLCRRVYPDQPNPLQVNALVKYWLGGPDPLDYISMYANNGQADQGIPPHWHYITFGLSDLHGDGRVHEVGLEGGLSGFGFELTFRLRREPGETAPPTWPAALLQSLAKYVFQSENMLCAGDHVSWHAALDGSESRLQHMLMAPDPQLGQLRAPTGMVTFVQVVGICAEELRVAQHWNGPGVIDILRRLPGAGGPWLVTDMRRGESMLELDVSVAEEVARGINTDGSNLSGVSARCSWAENSSIIDDGGRAERATLTEDDSEQIKSALRKGLLQSRGCITPNRNERNEDLSSSFNAEEGSEMSELGRVRKLKALHLTFNREAGSLLPLAIRGRVSHGRHFTFKSVFSDSAITLVSPLVTGIFVDLENPYAAHGAWLQMLLPPHVAIDMSDSLEQLTNPEHMVLPKTFSWPEHRLTITIMPD